MNIGDYEGKIFKPNTQPQWQERLCHLVANITSTPTDRLSNGPDYVVKTECAEICERPITIKVFKRQSRFKDWYDKNHGSKAKRSYDAACYLREHGITTPEPIAYLDRWENGRLIESYYLSIFEPGTSFRDALADIYYNLRDNAPLMDLLHLVAPAIRQMHDAGFMHGDLGNQNILLPKDADGHWGTPSFIDLNRARYAAPLTDKQRAFDLARIALPGAYLRIFKTIYNHHEEFPGEIETLEQKARKKFWNHRKNSKWRHPIRHLKQRNKPKGKPLYPPIQDIWLWDEKSAQPMIVPGRQEKHAYRNWGYMVSMLWSGLCAAPTILRNYKSLLQHSYTQPIAMRNRLGIALHPKADYIERELALLNKLGNPPVLVRFSHHETPDDWMRTIALVDQLHAKGIDVMLAILQDRQAILQPESWKNFLTLIVERLADKVSFIEITHASNRLKWGVWSSDDYAQLLAPALDLQIRFPQIKLSGPACIDFEYLPVIAALKKIPRAQPLAALSHLLYVDRRGAPENKQGKYSTLEKAALLKAVAQWSDRVDDKIIVSEVNWPVKYTGIYSPIGCPYTTPKWRREEPGEDNEDYANYLVRYYLICLCSGHVEQVFWWRLSANGYGLVDDLNDFTPRPAFYALKTLLAQINSSTFINRRPTETEDYLFEFSREDGSKFIIGWTTADQPKALPNSLQTLPAINRNGEPISNPSLSQSPIYISL